MYKKSEVGGGGGVVVVDDEKERYGYCEVEAVRVGLRLTPSVPSRLGCLQSLISRETNTVTVWINLRYVFVLEL